MIKVYMHILLIQIILTTYCFCNLKKMPSRLLGYETVTVQRMAKMQTIAIKYIYIALSRL